MQSGGISRKDFCRKWDEGLFDGKRTPYIIVCGLVYVGGKYWFVVLLHKCFQWKPCAKAAGNQSSASWHLQHMSVYVYLYMSIYRVLSLHFECVILICTRLCPCWLNLKPARQRVIRYAFVVLVQQTCCSWHVACVSCVCQAGPTGIGSWGLGIAGPDFFNCDHHTSLFEPWNSSLRRSTCPGEYESECEWAMGHLHLARRLCTRMLCFVPQLLCVLGWVNLPWKFWRSNAQVLRAKHSCKKY